MGGLPVVPNVTFHRGMTFDTLPMFLADNPDTHISLFVYDMDTYDGAIHALETSRKRFVKGTVLVFDEFTVLNSEFLAFYEFASKYRFGYEITSWGASMWQQHGMPSIFSSSFTAKDIWYTPLFWYSTVPVAGLAGLIYSPSWEQLFFELPGAISSVAIRITDLGDLHQAE